MFETVLYLMAFLAVCLLVIRRELFKRPIFFAILFVIGAIGSIFFEYPLISVGLWTHLVYPQILGVSWFAALMYIPFLGISYALGKALSKMLSQNEYVMFFISGMIVGFVIDLTSVALGFYRYNFTFPFAIGGVPLGITVAEGIAVSVVILISFWLSGIFSKIIKRK